MRPGLLARRFPQHEVHGITRQRAAQQKNEGQQAQERGEEQDHPLEEIAPHGVILHDLSPWTTDLRYLQRMARSSDEAPRCFRHPTEPGRRKCYFCHRPICAKCQSRADGHIYCSHHCSAAQRRSERMKRLGEWNRTALAGTWFRVALFSSLAVLGAAAVWLASHAELFMSVPEPPQATFKKPREQGQDAEKVNWDAPGAVVIESPSQGAVVRQNTTGVSGRAPAEAMVGLYVNGEKVDVQMCSGGGWRFEGVPLTAARNLVQARYFDNRGNSSYSPAVLVELQTSPARAVPAATERCGTTPRRPGQSHRGSPRGGARSS